jgi:tetratricopeptide (TPR) repeat protein
MLSIFIITTILGFNMNAQNSYEKGMKKAFNLWEEDKIIQASNLFERIGKAEKENWIPPFYAGYTLVISSFEMKDEATFKLKIEKAIELLNQASSSSPNNPEIMIVKALANTAYINFDSQKYGMTLSGKNEYIYRAALKIAPRNPRVILSKAEWDMGSAQFFGSSVEPYCKDIKRALDLFQNEEKSEVIFYPDWGEKKAQQIFDDCEG